jgi:hypothetical protein
MSGDDLRSRIGSALGEALHAEGDMVIKWVAVVEAMDADGERGVWCLADDEATAWDTLGLLAYATQREQAELTSRMGDGS